MSQEYWSYPAINNSILSEIERKVFNLQSFGNLEKAYEFGSLVHQLILEHHKPLPELVQISESELEEIKKMVRFWLGDRKFARLVQLSAKEKEVYWHDPKTGLPCKSKLDIINCKYNVYDLKTTAAINQKDFERSIVSFNYLRQAAFYFDSLGDARTFTFVGLQKAEPYQIFYKIVNRMELEVGRNQYRKLIDLGLKLGHFKHLQ